MAADLRMISLSGMVLSICKPLILLISASFLRNSMSHGRMSKLMVGICALRGCEKRRKRSFILVEVIVSLLFISIALFPLLRDALFQVSKHRDLNQKISAEIQCEERFYQELTRFVTSEGISFSRCENGYVEREKGRDSIMLYTTFRVLETPHDETVKVLLGKLTVSAYKEHDETSPLASRSLSLAFQGKEE